MKERIFFHDDFCEDGGHTEPIAVELNGRCPNIFPRKLAEVLMGSCIAVNFARDCNGKASYLREKGIICILLLAWGFVEFRERVYGKLTVIHISRAIPRCHLSEIEAFAITIACSYDHETAASDATGKRVNRADTNSRPF